MSYYYLFWEDTFDKVNYISLNLRYMNKYEWLSAFQKNKNKYFNMSKIYRFLKSHLNNVWKWMKIILISSDQSYLICLWNIIRWRIVALYFFYTHFIHACRYNQSVKWINMFWSEVCRGELLYRSLFGGTMLSDTSGSRINKAHHMHFCQYTLKNKGASKSSSSEPFLDPQRTIQSNVP